MAKAEFVIARCGYSTVMDLVKLQKKSILIPTPGQTEQEYLANHVSEKQIAVCFKQKNFSLVKAIDQAKEFSYHIPSISNNSKLIYIISDFLRSLK
jgi:UDP-N-acetylglucosamine:LPS N-acetylglucosamine transferase